MADTLISDLSSAAILVTDLIEHQPQPGVVSKKGTVTALFTVGAQLAIDRDNRKLIESGGGATVDWENHSLINSSTDETVNWDDSRLRASLKTVVDWSLQVLNDDSELLSVDWGNRTLANEDGTVVALFNNTDLKLKDGSNILSFDWAARKIFDIPGALSIDGSNRQLYAADGTTIIFDFGVQLASGGFTNNVTAGGTDDEVANYTSLTVYSTDAAAIRNNIYQLARKIKIINDNLISYGILA